MSAREVDVTSTPRFPVSLRTKKGRYRVEIQIGRGNYSATSDTPQNAMNGAAAMADLFGGYKLDLPEFPAPRHPLVVDVETAWSVVAFIVRESAMTVRRLVGRAVRRES